MKTQEERIERMEHIVKLLLLSETISTRSVKKEILAELRAESLKYLAEG